MLLRPTLKLPFWCRAMSHPERHSSVAYFAFRQFQLEKGSATRTGLEVSEWNISPPGQSALTKLQYLSRQFKAKDEKTKPDETAWAVQRCAAMLVWASHVYIHSCGECR